MNLEKFTRLVGETPRKVRYLIAEGFIPGPTGSRCRPSYGSIHISSVRRYQELRLKFSPLQIKAILAEDRMDDDFDVLELSDGIRLSVSRSADLHALDPGEIGRLASAGLVTLILTAIGSLPGRRF
jgi:hypothetical protein